MSACSSVSLQRKESSRKQIEQAITMVESGREYVLQWPGHAAYVTERFSGLLARQTLVDVTLICDEQKLRVHKLVLASCSLYFEEILAEDLEPEPIIVLRDLNFNILKAMIEFMYCGETTVSHVHLPSLLTAARLFKVKELECLVEKMVGSHVPDLNDNNECLSKAGRVNGIVNAEIDNGIRVSFSNKRNGDCVDDGAESSSDDSERIYSEENASGNCYDTPNDGCLYDDSCAIFNDCMLRNKAAMQKNATNTRNKPLDSMSDSGSENCEKESYEGCCDFVNCANGRVDNEINQVGQCSRVYTHKKRKVNNSDDKASSATRQHSQFEKASSLQPSSTSNRIDLIDESSNDEAPVTLKTNLDNLESLDYILSFNSESVQSIVGCPPTDFCPSATLELLNARTHVAAAADTSSDEKDSAEEDSSNPPVLRRSVRLNQQESEDTVDSGKSKDDDKKSSSSSVKLLSRAKRKNKESERRVVLLSGAPPSRKNNHSSTRTLRKSAAKLTANKCKNHLTSKESVAKSVEEQATEQQSVECVKPNTTASVNRALWGDMSDVAEVSEEFLEYSTSAEIPFAVGLLPLRAALERMQATLDHQPRKTRSSAAITKQESSCFKRKQSPSSRQQQQLDENSSAVCHILQIRTSPQCSRPRKRSLSDGAATLGQATIDGPPS